MKKISNKIKTFLANPKKIKKSLLLIFASIFLCSNFVVLNSSKEVSFLKKSVSTQSKMDHSMIDHTINELSLIPEPSAMRSNLSLDSNKTNFIEDQNEQKQIEVLLLLALPAAGKSEIRNYLSNISDEERLREFNVGSMIQIDDFPYVFFMRRISEELEKREIDPIYYQSETLPLTDPNDWKMLVHLINEDYEDIINQNKVEVNSAAFWLFDRLDAASLKIGKEPKLSELPENIRNDLASVLEDEASQIFNDKLSEISKAKDKNTIVIEFSRGGSMKSKMPLPAPFGYENSLPELSDEILQRASILYVDVTPDASRERNVARFDPKKASSILNHKVPQAVMYKDYGCDDIKWLIENSKTENSIEIYSHNTSYNIPTYIFDNRADKTSFARKKSDNWSKKDKKTFQNSLKKSFKVLKK